MDGNYEVLSPWAEADPRPLKGISTQIADLAGKKVGFFRNSKRAARPILANLENKLKTRFPSIEISHFVFLKNDDITATSDLPGFESWLKEVDAVILAYGD
jgi:hypothetical protein